MTGALTSIDTKVFKSERRKITRKFHVTLLLMALLILAVGLSVSASDHDELVANQAKTARFYEEVLNTHNTDAMAEFMTADSVEHNPSSGQAPDLRVLNSS